MGSLTETLVNDEEVTLSREEFIASGEVKRFEDRPWRLRERAVPFRVARRVARTVEDRFDAPFVRVYPRLAVAMGGALTTRLDEKKALRDFQGGTSSPGLLKNPPGADWSRG